MVIVLGGAVYASFYFNSMNQDANGTIEYYMAYTPPSSSAPQPPNSKPILGCGTEYAVRVESVNGTTGGLAEALNELFTIDNLDYDGTDYVNTLYQSDANVSVTETAGQVTVDIVGQILSGGTCDDPRIMSQIDETVAYYANGTPYTIKLNGDEQAWACFGDMSGNCM